MIPKDRYGNELHIGDTVTVIIAYTHQLTEVVIESMSEKTVAFTYKSTGSRRSNNYRRRFDEVIKDPRKTSIQEDDDGHWYRIKEEDEDRFHKLVEMEWDDEGFDEECVYFSGYTIDYHDLR